MRLNKKLVPKGAVKQGKYDYEKKQTQYYVDLRYFSNFIAVVVGTVVLVTGLIAGVDYLSHLSSNNMKFYDKECAFIAHGTPYLVTPDGNPNNSATNDCRLQSNWGNPIPL